MSGEREIILNALLAMLRTGLQDSAERPPIDRGLDLPTEVPAGGALILRDGELELAGTVLSPLRYELINHAELELFVAGADAAGRDADMATLRADVVALIIADRTLGGLVEWLDASEPENQGLPIAGAEGLKTVLVTIDAYFNSESPLG